MKKIVVIGSSAASIGFLTKLRQLDSKSKIICISKSKHLPYNKCLLADYIAQTANEDRVFFKDLNFFKKNNIELFLDTKVINLNTTKNLISLENKKQIKFDLLFIGTGTSPTIPQIKNIENLKHIFTFQTIDDAWAISDFIKNKKVKNATIVGTGLTGIELADTLSCLNIKINLIGKYKQIMPNQLDKNAAAIIEKLISKRNINFIKNTVVTEIKKGYKLFFDNKKNIQTNMMIFATGNKTNIDFLQKSKIKIQDDAILTNEYMQTNIKNIYAGGDVCLVKDILTKEYVRSSTWPDATKQGMIAASNIKDKKEIYQGIIQTTCSHIFGKTFISCGSIAQTPKNCKIIIKKDQDFYHKFLIKDDKLIGFILLGKINQVGFFKKMILEKLSCKSLSNLES
ncbi:hypothetical protein GF322_03075 [Candidatus Dependentiae bacterium]|nr:hypothetical protein [Candidatus Dependentiae bacterium]